MIRTAISIYEKARLLLPIGMILAITICPWVSTLIVCALLIGPIIYVLMSIDGCGSDQAEHGTPDFLRLYGYLTIIATIYPVAAIGGLAFSHSIGLFVDYSRPFTPTIGEFVQVMGVLWLMTMCAYLLCTISTFEIVRKDIKSRNGDVDI